MHGNKCGGHKLIIGKQRKAIERGEREREKERQIVHVATHVQWIAESNSKKGHTHAEERKDKGRYTNTARENSAMCLHGLVCIVLFGN